MGSLSKLEVYGIGLLLIVLAAGAFGFYEHHQGYLTGKLEVQTKFDAFVNETKAAGLKQQQDNLDKEKTYAAQIATANTGRADALQRLQLAQQAAERAGRRAASNNPAAAAGRSKVCFTAAGYNAAFKQFGADLDRFIQNARGFAVEGDAAQIDATTLIRAWPIDQPKAQPTK